MFGRRDIAATVWVVFLCLGLGCSAEPPMSPVEVVSVTINGAPAVGLPALTRGDDNDPEVSGVQVNIKLVLEKLPSTSGYWLRVGARELEGAVMTDNEVAFNGVTLDPGDNQIQAGCDLCQTVQLDVALYAPGIDLRDFVQHPITCLSHDEDPSTEGIQHEFLVRATQIADGTLATVSIGDQEHTTVISDGEGYVQVTLPAESGQIGLLVETTADGEPITAEGTFTIHCPRCELTHIGDATVESLREGSTAIYLGQRHDGDADPGFQTDLVVTSGGLPGTMVEIWADDVKLAETTQAAEGETRLTNVALNGSHRVRARCRYGDLPVTEGPSLEINVDITPPAAIDDLQCSRDDQLVHCLWTSPEDPGSATGVYDWEMRYLLDGELSASNYAEAQELSPFPAVTLPGEPCYISFWFVDHPNAQISFAMRGWDRAGNASPISNVAVIPSDGE